MCVLETYQIPSSCFPAKKEEKTGEKQVGVFVLGHFQVYKCDISVIQKAETSMALLLHSNTQWKNLDN